MGKRLSESGIPPQQANAFRESRDDAAWFRDGNLDTARGVDDVRCSLVIEADDGKAGSKGLEQNGACGVTQTREDENVGPSELGERFFMGNPPQPFDAVRYPEDLGQPLPLPATGPGAHDVEFPGDFARHACQGLDQQVQSFSWT